jgi:CHAT domain-containing protein/Tfp pilus assembly protein PilF
MSCKVNCFGSIGTLIRTLLALTWVSVLLLSATTGPAARAAAHHSPAAVFRPQQTEPAAQEATLLELNMSIDRELAGGQKHEYEVKLSEGQYAGLTIDQSGIEVQVRSQGPDGKRIAEFGSRVGVLPGQKLELVAEAEGGYRLSVVAMRPKAPAGRYAIRFVELRPATEKDRSIQEARRLYSESVRLIQSGKFGEARPLAERALEIREGALGSGHPDLATSLSGLGLLYSQGGDYIKAEQLSLRALESWERAVGTERPEFAGALSNAGNVYYLKGDFVKAEQLFKRALEIRERTLGPEHSDVADSLNNLAIINSHKGDFVTAEQFDSRALEIRVKILGPEHPIVATSLNNLAIVHRNRGDLIKAEQLYERSLGIREKTLGPNHPDVATTFSNLAVVHLQRGDLDKAELLNLRALEIREKVLGAEHPHVAASLNNLGEVYQLKGDYLRAEPLQQRALKIREKAMGPVHPEVATSLNNLAVIQYQKGDLANAERLYDRVLSIMEKSLGPNHPEVAWSLSSVATVYAEKGDLARAVATQVRASEITERNIALNLVSGSERQKLAYLTQLSEATDRTLSLHIGVAPDSPQAKELAASIILQRKGRVLDVTSDSLTKLRRHLTVEDQKLLDRFSDTAAQLARLVLNGPQRMTLAEHQQRVKALEEEREKLESDLSLRTAGFYEAFAPVTLAAIRKVIPAEAALIEFFSYRPFYPKNGPDKAYGDPRYVAYVLRPQGDIRWKELGEAKQIDGAIDAFRAALHNPNRRDVQRLARKVDESVMQPVRALLGDATHLLVSPDGALNLVPFEAFVDDQNRYLVQRYSFTYLTSGRDLLRLQVPRPTFSKAVVIANPSYGEPEAPTVAQAATRDSRPAGRAQKRQSAAGGTDLTSIYFAPLGATAQEAQSIKAQFSDAALWTGTQATESALKQMAAPRLLHIATHGFFLGDSPQNSTGSNRADTRAINSNLNIENPLLRSGLALAGANLRRGGDDDGVLTALEASGLNLWGTKLVVLSACDTGIGEVKAGEGVYGLRRAFVLAGTEALVMSLWQVSDYVTRELMANYYKGLRQGRGRGEALREVQLSMLKQNRRAHPFYWASFIQTGEWGNLDGKR